MTGFAPLLDTAAKDPRIKAFAKKKCTTVELLILHHWMNIQIALAISGDDFSENCTICGMTEAEYLINFILIYETSSLAIRSYEV